MPFNFLTELLKVTKIVESPTSYLEWAGYATVAAVMRHRLYIDFPSRRTKVTPNIYVLLVGDSGATRKSTPLKIANFLLKRVGNTKLIEGRASIQGVLKELAGKKREGKRILEGAAAMLYSEEFAAFLVKDPSTTSILTDIYDYKDTHEILLKSEDTLKLENVCITLLSATNAAFLQDMFTKTDLYGGLVGRTIFVIEERARHKNLGLHDDTSEKDWDPLIHHLIKLSQMEGPVVISEQANEYLEQWYNDTDFSWRESKTGYEHRAHTHVMKMALIFAACEEGFNKEINLSHCERAVELINSYRKNYHQLVATVGTSINTTTQAAKDITLILFRSVKEKLTKRDILQRAPDIDSETFEKAMITLEQKGFVKLGGTGTTFYELTKDARELIMGSVTVPPRVN